MTTEEVRAGLQTHILGREIFIYEQIGSTNDLALQRGIEGAQEGMLIIAESQTMGRGRRGRRWHAAPGLSILASLILRHRLLANQIELPNLIGAFAIAAAIRELTGFPAQIKSPNDVLICGKKVGGILTELEYDRHRATVFRHGIRGQCQRLTDGFPRGTSGLCHVLTYRRWTGDLPRCAYPGHPASA